MRSGTFILHPGALGDVVLALPVLRRLAERGGRPLAVAARSGVSRLLELCPFIDLPLDEDGLGVHRLYGEEPPDAPDRLYDLIESSLSIIALHADKAGELRRGLVAWGASRVTAASHIPPAGYPRHAQDYLARILLGEESSEPEPAPSLAIPGTSRDEKLVAIHPGSGSSVKNWPLAGFERVARALEEEGEKVLWILGPAEQSWRIPGRQLAGPPLVELARAIASCRVFVGNDSGPTHLAAALGTPTVALFGPTSPVVWAPRGPRIRILWKEGGLAGLEGSSFRETIRPEDVLEAVRELSLAGA